MVYRDRLRQPAVAAAWRLILLTAQRPGEVLSMRWRDLERDSRGWWWNLPAELTKTNRAHRVPLSPQALAIIEDLRPLTESSGWVLASRADGKHAKRKKRLRAGKEDERKLRVEVLPAWGSRPAAEIRRADVRSLLERIAEERGGVCANRLTWLSHSSARLREWSGLEHFTPHDLRRTAATWLGRHGIRPDTIDQLLNHEDDHDADAEPTQGLGRAPSARG